MFGNPFKSFRFKLSLPIESLRDFTRILSDLSPCDVAFSRTSSKTRVAVCSTLLVTSYSFRRDTMDPFVLCPLFSAVAHEEHAAVQASPATLAFTGYYSSASPGVNPSGL